MVFCQSIYNLDSFDKSIPFSYGYSVYNGLKPALAVSQVAVKERKVDARMMQTFWMLITNFRNLYLVSFVKSHLEKSIFVRNLDWLIDAVWQNACTYNFINI